MLKGLPTNSVDAMLPLKFMIKNKGLAETFLNISGSPSTLTRLTNQEHIHIILDKYCIYVLMFIIMLPCRLC